MKSIMRGRLVGALTAATFLLGTGATAANAATTEAAVSPAWAAAPSVAMTSTAPAPIRIENRRSGKCLEVGRYNWGPPVAQGAKVQQWDCQSGKDQQWQANNLNKSGAQRWTLWAEELDGNGNLRYVSFRVVLSGQCLEVNQADGSRGLGNGAGVLQLPCHHGAQQQWKQIYKGGGFFQFQNRRSGKCLEIHQAEGSRGLGNGAEALQWSCHNGAWQQWKARP
ncbi:RICIN domain-containing protein [Sphaerisporangium sp. NBC_01403]|uniref:RICIN domain-containing protein n=1 Tax=Sphaerisporangium sp. NBC_01403 TaxID=2903599 RepID=UPI0032435B61